MSEFNIKTVERPPHAQRSKEILKKYPQVRGWARKKNPWGLFIIIGAVGFQTFMAIFLAEQSWWLVFLVAFFFGTIINHTCIAMIHESAHDLLFKTKILNPFAGLLVNMHMFIPSAISFKKYHLKHHSNMGVYDIDADLPSKWELKLVKNIWYRKFLWLVMFPFCQMIRTMRIKQVNDLDIWVVANVVLTIGYDIFMYYYFGPIAFLYIAVSFWFCFGFSTVGGRIIQEHFLFGKSQETYSYYGMLSLPSLHVGHHSEHHDFPTMPWNYLPKLRRLVPEVYESIHFHTSWNKLIFQFIFDSKISLSDRIIR